MCSSCFRFTVPIEYDSVRAGVFLRRFCGLTARSLTLLKRTEGGITRSGELVKTCDVLSAGDVIELDLPEDENDITPVEGELEILYEDDHLLIVNKPPFMPVHPTKVHQLDTLANVVSFYQNKKGESCTFRALNRLDKDTTGCVMIAKDRLSYALIQPTIIKTYTAVCEGIILEPGVIDAPISLSDGSKIKRTVSDKGQRAVTRYAPLAHGNDHTLLELRLETGRTHQIRCHISSIGHPLAGDDLYGGSRRLINRQALHCKSVRFLLPFTKEEMIITADTPAEFFKILEDKPI